MRVTTHLISTELHAPLNPMHLEALCTPPFRARGGWGVTGGCSGEGKTWSESEGAAQVYLADKKTHPPTALP